MSSQALAVLMAGPLTPLRAPGNGAVPHAVAAEALDVLIRDLRLTAGEMSGRDVAV